MSQLSTKTDRITRDAALKSSPAGQCSYRLAGDDHVLLVSLKSLTRFSQINRKRPV